jgi:hypothetical protein
MFPSPKLSIDMFYLMIKELSHLMYLGSTPDFTSLFNDTASAAFTTYME